MNSRRRRRFGFKRTVGVKSEREIETIEKASRIVAVVLDEIKDYIEPGISTFEIDKTAEGIIRREGGRPKFKGYRGFPAALCTSVNEEVVHGVPRKSKIVYVGDILSIDVGVEVDGYCGDGARTYPVGEISEEAKKLLDVTREALYLGIECAVEGNYVSDISRTIQTEVERNGFSVVRALVGHGVGRDLHEEPQIPNFVSDERDKRIGLVRGMVLAIEPMVNAGAFEVVFDGQWMVRSQDKSLSAHFEHTVVITKDGPKILTKH